MAELMWNGDQIVAAVTKASRLAIDSTMAFAIEDAKLRHGPGAHGIIDFEGRPRFENRSGDLNRSIRVVQAAKRVRRGVSGLWGSISIVYARRIELGFQGKDSLGRSYDRPGAPHTYSFPFLRPAAGRQYPKLIERVRKEFAKIVGKARGASTPGGPSGA